MNKFTTLVNLVLDDKFALVKYVLFYAMLMLCSMAFVVATTFVVKAGLLALFTAISLEIRLFITNDYMKFGLNSKQYK